jgi:hypothetical protein
MTRGGAHKGNDERAYFLYFVGMELWPGFDSDSALVATVFRIEIERGLFLSLNIFARSFPACTYYKQDMKGL